jgi:hypothetical protein
LTIIAHIVMAVWIPIMLVLFAVLPPRRAVIVSFLGAWLFLPNMSYPVPMLPDYTKMSATCAGVFIATMIYDAKRLLRFKPSWIDAPMLIYCFCPMITSLLNGLGPWDGASEIMRQTVTWGLPYLVGRLYFNDVQGMRELAIGVVIGGLLYVPLCLFEVRMSPKLHNMVYGFFKRNVQMRYGGWRPAVFLDGGLQLGMYMTAASLFAIWLTKTRAWRKLWGVSALGLTLILFVTTVLCRATGALALLALGLIVMWVCSRTKSRIPVACLLAIAPVYLALRSTALWEGEPILSMAKWIDEDRAASLEFRFINEDKLAAHAMQQPWFGWGSWGRGRLHDEWGKDSAVTDGWWIIEFGTHGLVGMASCFCALLAPLATLTWRYSARQLTSMQFAPAFALGILVTLYAIDCLPNALIDPLFMMLGGAVGSFALAAHNVRNAAVVGGSSRKADDSRPDAVPLRRLHPGCS